MLSAASPRFHIGPAVVVLVAIGLAWAAFALQYSGLPVAQAVDHHQLADASWRAVLANAPLFALVWTLMSVGMMLPSSLPMVLAYQRIAAIRGPVGGVWLFVGGYLLAWAGYGLLAYGMDFGIHEAVESSVALEETSRYLAPSAVLAAGAYQLTPLKDVCLSKCRTPLAFLAGPWSTRLTDALVKGLSYGLFCVGCCWVLMLLMFALGVGNLAWMALLALVMVVERATPFGGRAIMPVAVLLLGAGVVLVAFTATGVAAFNQG